MKKINIPKNFKQYSYRNTSNNIKNNNDTNNNKCSLNNSLTLCYKNKDISSLKEDKFVYNSIINPKNNVKKYIYLSKIKNIPFPSNNHNYNYEPFSSSRSKKLKNNFIFYNNNENKTIYRTNQTYAYKSKIKNYKMQNKQNNKVGLIETEIVNKEYPLLNYSVSKKLNNPLINGLDIIGSLDDSPQIYQTPKNVNVIFPKNSKNRINIKYNNKIKYKKIFNETEAKSELYGKNKTLEKNWSVRCDDLYKLLKINSLKPQSLDCDTPFRFLRNYKKFPKKFTLQNSNHKYINLNNNDSKNTITNINNFNLNYDYQTNIDPVVKAIKNKNMIGNDKESRILCFSSNFDHIINKNEIIGHYYNDIKNSMLIPRRTQETKNKKIIFPNDNLLNVNSDIDTKSSYENRPTNYIQKNHQNVLYMNQLINAKRLSPINKNKKDINNNNSALRPDNKENLNNNSKFIQDSILEIENTTNNMSLRSKLNKKKYLNQKKSGYLFSFANKNLYKKILIKKVNTNNKSDMIKSQISFNNKPNKNGMENIINEYNNYSNIMNAQKRFFFHKTNIDISKLKGEQGKFKSKIDNTSLNNMNNNVIKRIIKQKQLKKNKCNISKTNINNKGNTNKNINKDTLLLSNSKLSRKKNLCLNTDLNKNANNDELLNSSSKLKNSNQFKNSQQSLTTLNTTNTNKNPADSFRYINLNKEIISKENKCIFALYYRINIKNKNKSIQISVVGFDAEEAIFKIKKIENTNNFYRNFYESINKVNNSNKSLYLMKDENFYIVTGGNYNKLYKYKFGDKKMEQKIDLKYNHSNGGIISFNEEIIILSGNYNKKVEVFSESNNIYFELPEMQIERSYFSSCIIKNRFLFIFFGYNYPSKMYLDTIEYFDILNYDINLYSHNNSKQKNICWKYLKYNYFSSNPSNENINLIGGLAINYLNEKIILLGGIKKLDEENNNKGYYQFIFDENDLERNGINSYIEKISVKNLNKFDNNYLFNYNFKYIEELNRNNNMKEPTFAAFDSNYNAHLIKLSTMNHEIFHFNN